MTKKLTKRLTKKDDHEVDQETNQVDNDISKTDEVEKSKNMSLSDMIPYANMTLKKCGFKLSPTQSQTPKDGNCLAWSLSDQLTYDPINSPPMDHSRLRSLVVSSLPKMLQAGNIEWVPYEGMETPQVWMTKMSVAGVFLDELFIQIASIIFDRSILVLNVMGQHILEYESNNHSSEPLYLLYFEECYTSSPHYQSIRPLAQ